MPQIYHRSRELPLTAPGSQPNRLDQQRQLLEELVTAVDAQLNAALSRPWQSVTIKRVRGAPASQVLDAFEVEIRA